MCEILLLDIGGEDSDFFQATFEDCNQFEGNIDCSLLFESPKNGLYSIKGISTDGKLYEAEILVPNSERINPTKVFKWVAKKLKEVLCPTCS
jgi:hypothetical protein